MGDRRIRRRRTVPIMAGMAALAAAAATLVPTGAARAVHGDQADLPPATIADAAAFGVPDPPPENVRHVSVAGADILPEYFDVDRQYAFLSFYPETLKVRQHDLVEWRFGPSMSKWHTVTFEPADMDVAAHPEPEAEHAIARFDEHPSEAGVWGFDERLMLGNGEALDPDERCGMRAADSANGTPPLRPCHIDSTEERYSNGMNRQFFDSAQSQGSPYWAYMDLEPGAYRYHCAFHPEMDGYVEVVADDAAIPTAAEVEEQAVAELAADIATADSMYDEVTAAAGSRPEGDHTVWDVFVGATSEDQRVMINDYLPHRVEVAPGDVVEFKAADEAVPRAGPVEVSTVTFPSESVGGFTLGRCDLHGCTYKPHDAWPSALERDVFWGLAPAAFPWACEHDEPNGGSPALATWVPRQGCPDGAQIEWLIDEVVSKEHRAPGDAVVSPATFHSSALMTRDDLADWAMEWPDGTPLQRTFRAVFPVDGEFTYSCLIHPQAMVGSIGVSSGLA